MADGRQNRKTAAAVSRGIPSICRGDPRNLANGTAEFGKICRGKLWALQIINQRMSELSQLAVLSSVSYSNFIFIASGFQQYN